MKKIIYILITAALLFFSGCEDRSDLTAPEPPSTGTADFSTFVALGNSLTAGYQSNSLYQEAQEYSYPNLIANQVGTEFVQPLISDPGIPGKLYVDELVYQDGVLANVVLSQSTGNGTPLNSDYGSAFNNLGVPGSILFHLPDETGAGAASGNVYFNIVMRSTAFGESLMKQAINKNPTFITLWIGNNDVLGYATSGGTSGTDATMTMPTDPAVFTQLYTILVSQLNATGAKIVTANIPDVKAIPFFTTVGPKVSLSLSAAMQANPNIVGLFYQKNGETVASGIATPTDLATGNILMTLRGSEYAAYLGQATDKFYTDNGITPPAGIDTNQPFGFHPQNPWPDVFTLDADEQAIVASHTSSFNTTIANVTSQTAGVEMVDIHSFFNTIHALDGTAAGYVVDGISFKTTFLTGNIFSLDGVHPTSQGYAIVANEFIKVINDKFGASIPEINVATIPNSITIAKTVKIPENILPVFANGSLHWMPF